MARIRSIHPGQWKDDEFVLMSPVARLLCIALRNLADDQGIFEWKPAQIKMECLPNDNCQILELMAELIEAQQVRQYEINGRKYGAIRNFRVWQRPKSPNALYPITDEIGNYLGLSGEKSGMEPPPKRPVTETKPSSTPPISEIKPPKAPKVAPSTPSISEISPQMEDVGDKMKEVEEGRELTLSPSRDDVSMAFDAYNQAAKRFGFRTAIALNEQRKRRLRARVKECGGVDGFVAVLERAGASKFCRGETNGFKLDIDFVLQEQRVIHIMEGRYDDRAQASGRYNNASSIQQGFALVDREGQDGEGQDGGGDDLRVLS